MGNIPGIGIPGKKWRNRGNKEPYYEFIPKYLHTY